MNGTIRTNWLKGMYLANLVISGPIGLAHLIVPDVMRGVMGIPAGDPIHFGIGAGAIPLAFGIAGALGLRAPLRLAPVLLLQVLYKSAFLVGLVLPLAMQGAVPDYAIPLTVLFVLFIIGDLIALPFPYLFSRAPEHPMAPEP